MFHALWDSAGKKETKTVLAKLTVTAKREGRILERFLQP